MSTHLEARGVPSLRSLLRAVLHDGRRIAGVALIVWLAAVCVAWLVPLPFIAQSTLLVLLSPEYASRPDAGSERLPQPVMTLERGAILASEISIIKSRSLARDVVEAIGVRRLYPAIADGEGWLAGSMLASSGSPTERAVERFIESLKASPEKSGSTIELSFKHRDAATAADALNRLVDAYQARRTGIFANPQSGLVEEKTREAADALARRAAELAAFQREAGISDFGTQLDILLRRQGELRAAQQEADTVVAETSQRLATIAAQLGRTPSQIIQHADFEADRRIQAARDALVELRRQDSELAAVFAEGSQKRVAVREQIAAMEREMGSHAAGGMSSSVRRGTNEVHASLQLDRVRQESELGAARQKKREIQGQLGALDARIAELQERRTRLEALARDKALAEQAYLDAAKTRNERRTAEDIEARRAANVRVVQAAEVPLQSRPTRIAVLLGGAVLAVLAGVATAALSSLMRRSFISPEGVEASLRIPVLAVVPHGDAARAVLEIAHRPAPRW